MKATPIVCLAGVLAIALLLVFQDAAVFASANGRYYFTVSVLFSVFISAIGLSRLIRHALRADGGHTSPTIPTAPPPDPGLSRPRNAYRIHYDAAPRPVFVEKSDVPEAAPTFTCPVIDVSETGLSLGCEGIYATDRLVQGEIIFDSGRTAPVNGVVVREQNGRTALKLHCLIDPFILMLEQREQILQHKEDDSLPIINPLAKPPPHPLPSYQPKGVCRTDPS